MCCYLISHSLASVLMYVPSEKKKKKEEEEEK